MTQLRSSGQTSPLGGDGDALWSRKNRGRGRHGELEDVYHFDGKHYRLAKRR